MKLQLANYKKKSLSFGKTQKSVVWLQGCKFNCNNCIAIEWQKNDGGYEKEMDELVQDISNADAEGVVISGGEPLLQYEEVLHFSKIIKQQKKGILLYTGFSKEEVKKEYYEILEYTDILITGKFIDNKNNGKGLRGSTNQDIQFLTERYIAEKDYFFNGNRILEIDISNDSISFCGIPPLV